MARPEFLLLSATEGEAREIAAGMREVRTTHHAGKTAVAGWLERWPCRLVYTGIGAVNAAQALTWQLEQRRPHLVVQFGIAGAYVPAGVPVGAVAVASEEIYGDLGVLTPQGWQPADLIGIPVVPAAAGEPPRFNRFPLRPELVARAVAAASRAGSGGTSAEVRRGPFLTLGQVTGVGAAGDALYRRFGALCESMEGAAAAHVCALYRLPFLEVRGVSNLVEDRDRSRWRIAPAAHAAQEALRHILAGVAELVAGESEPHQPVDKE
ncbi:MAG TPA: futalosine hydrolase [Chloroflexota bacterium]|nr:futalosine hydrolase [Chloroflexota bacterium]